MAENGGFVKVSILYDEKQVAISSVNISVIDQRIILFGEDFDIIPHQSVVDVIGYSEDGVVVMCGQVTLSTKSQLNIDIIKSDDKQDRRKYLKVKTNRKTMLYKAYSMGKSKRNYSINERIETRDLSLGGICFYSNRTFLKKQKVSMDFGFLRQGFIAQAEILRRVKGEFKGSYRYKYGCRFVNMNSEEERALCEYVFRIQIENHRKLAQKEEMM